MARDLVLVAVAYLLGSVPFGILIARLQGDVDLRRVGSGNIGATNVLRAVGKGAAALTLLGDIGKGALAVGCGAMGRGVLGGRGGRGPGRGRRPSLPGARSVSRAARESPRRSGSSWRPCRPWGVSSC